MELHIERMPIHEKCQNFVILKDLFSHPYSRHTFLPPPPVCVADACECTYALSEGRAHVRCPALSKPFPLRQALLLNTEYWRSTSTWCWTSNSGPHDYSSDTSSPVSCLSSPQSVLSIISAKCLHDRKRKINEKNSEGHITLGVWPSCHKKT